MLVIVDWTTAVTADWKPVGTVTAVDWKPVIVTAVDLKTSSSSVS
jgi:hypothetical protein